LIVEVHHQEGVHKVDFVLGRKITVEIGFHVFHQHVERGVLKQLLSAHLSFLELRALTDFRKKKLLGRSKKLRGKFCHFKAVFEGLNRINCGHLLLAFKHQLLFHLLFDIKFGAFLRTDSLLGLL
jgi:hypothetical protein